MTLPPFNRMMLALDGIRLAHKNTLLMKTQIQDCSGAVVRLSEPRPELRVLSSKANVPIISRGKLHRMGAWPSPGPKDTQAYVQDYCLSGLRGRDGSLDRREPHLFDKVPGIRGEVGGQHQLPFHDFIHSFLSVLCGEGRLEEAEGESSLAGSSHPVLPQPGRGVSPTPTLLPRSWTCRSSEHVVHQGPQAPPVHCPVVAAAH